MPRRACLLLSIVFFAPFLTGQRLALHDGDTVLFYGDSITAQRLYTRFFEDIVLTRYPHLHITFVNSGVPGDTVYGGYTGDQATRLQRDIIPSQPTVIAIMLGMNDGYYVPFEQKYFDIYTGGYRALLSAIQNDLPETRITLLTPTPYDEVTHGTEFARYNEVVTRHADFVRSLAASAHFSISDFFAAVTKLTEAGASENKSLAALLAPDRIHPSEATHWIMAAELARTWGVSPVVSRAELNGTDASIHIAENTQISELARTSSGLQWTQTDSAIPLPLPLEDGMIQFVLGISELSAMDQQILRVIDLPAKEYMLKIDGKPINLFSQQQLARGVNLALFSTPMENQARDVDEIELKRSQLDQATFILTIDGPNPEANSGIAKWIKAKDAELSEQARKKCKPQPRRFELIAQ